MLFVIIVIAILGTNLLLGFFVANTLGYGPQTLDEILTGVYKAPIGWARRRLTSGELNLDKRQQWVNQLGRYCCTSPSDPLHDRNSEADEDVEINGAAGEESEPDSFEDASDSQPENEVPADPSGDPSLPGDWAILQQVMQFAEVSPILLDELRFRWKYEPRSAGGESDLDLESNTDESIDSEFDEPSENMEDDSEKAFSQDSPSFPVWDRNQLLDSLNCWNDYLEVYEPQEVLWWLEWFEKWERFADRWRHHYQEVSALGLVERLMGEPPTEPTEPPPPRPQSVRAQKNAEENPAPAPPVKVNSRQKWVRGQHGRLIQSLFRSARELRQAQQELLIFTRKQARQQWPLPERNETPLDQSLEQAASLPAWIDFQAREDFEPNFAILVLPNYRQLLELDAGSLVSTCNDLTVSRTVADWQAAGQIGGRWYRNGSMLIGLQQTDEASIHLKSSWLLQSLNRTRFKNDTYCLDYSCNVIVLMLPEDDIAEAIENAILVLNRANLQRRLLSENACWVLKGRKLSLSAMEEVDTVDSEQTLAIEAGGVEDVLSAGVLNGLVEEAHNDTQDHEDDFEDDEDW